MCAHYAGSLGATNQKYGLMLDHVKQGLPNPVPLPLRYGIYGWEKNIFHGIRSGKIIVFLSGLNFSLFNVILFI